MSIPTQIGRYQVSELVESGDDLEFKFHLPSDGNCTTVNRLRQAIVSDVPTLAIDMVEITTNTSDLADEVLGLRLNLIPVRKTSDETPSLSLEVGPTSKPYEVTTRDLKLTGVTSICDDIVICKLRRGQAIKLKAEIKMGTGREHAKWSPLIHFTYQLTEKNCYRVQMTSLGTVPPGELLKSGLSLMHQ